MIDSILVVKLSHAVFFFGGILQFFLFWVIYFAIILLQLDLTLFLNSTSDII